MIVIESLDAFPDMLRMQRRFFFQQRQAITLQLDHLSAEENAAYGRKIRHELSLCGCEMATLLSLGSSIAYALLMLLGLMPVRMSLFASISGGLGTFIVMAAVGKLVGRYRHRLILRRVLDEISARVVRETEPSAETRTEAGR